MFAVSYSKQLLKLSFQKTPFFVLKQQFALVQANNIAVHNFCI